MGTADLRHHDLSRRDELDELVEEVLVPMLGVMALSQVPINPLRPDRLDPQALPFDARQDLPHQSTSDGIRLDDQQRRFLRHPSPYSTRQGPKLKRPRTGGAHRPQYRKSR